MDIFLRVISAVSDMAGITASSIAIYLFFFKKEEFLEAYEVLKNYTHQLTVSELKLSLAKLKDLNADDPASKGKVRNVISGIVGQIKGNKKIYPCVTGIVAPWERFLDEPKTKMSESLKSRIAAELDEKLRHVFIENFQVGGVDNGKNTGSN